MKKVCVCVCVGGGGGGCIPACSLFSIKDVSAPTKNTISFLLTIEGFHIYNASVKVCTVHACSMFYFSMSVHVGLI